MKKLLCFLGIIILLSLVLFPPILRIILPDKDKIEEHKAIERLTLSCSNESFITSTLYDGDKITMIIMKKINSKDDEKVNKNTVGNDLLMSFETLKDKGDIIYNQLEDGEVISIDFSVSEHKSLDLTKFKNNVENQQKYYEEQNLVCTIRK